MKIDNLFDGVFPSIKKIEILNDKEIAILYINWLLGRDKNEMIETFNKKWNKEINEFSFKIGRATLHYKKIIIPDWYRYRKDLENDLSNLIFNSYSGVLMYNIQQEVTLVRDNEIQLHQFLPYSFSEEEEAVIDDYLHWINKNYERLKIV